MTQAYFLFFDAKRGGWDERGEVFVRYGPPAEMQYDPVGGRLSWAFGSGPEFPANVMVWSYPELGMRVTLEDRLLSEYYLLPMSRMSDPDPLPDPDSLAKCADALGTRGGRGVFHLLPPGAKPLPLESLVARFEGSAGPRVLAQLEVPGGPADSVWADWVVLDSARVIRARASSLARALGVRGRDPARRRLRGRARARPVRRQRDRAGRRGPPRHPARARRARGRAVPRSRSATWSSPAARPGGGAGRGADRARTRARGSPGPGRSRPTSRSTTCSPGATGSRASSTSTP